MESPYMEGGPTFIGDLAAAVWVCHRTYEEGRDRLNASHASVVEEALEWAGSFRASIGMVGPWRAALLRLLGRGRTAADEGKRLVDAFTAEETLFRSYLEAHTRAPKRWKKGDEKAAKSPWPLTIAIGLQRELGWTETRAWNAPLQEALWAFAVISEANGDDSLISEEEEVAAKWAKDCREGRADPTRPPWLKASPEPTTAQPAATGRASQWQPNSE